MEVTEKITLDMLTKEGVSVLRQKFININDVEVQVGENVRNAFTNCEDDRKILKEQLSEDYGSLGTLNITKAQSCCRRLRLLFCLSDFV